MAVTPPPLDSPDLDKGPVWAFHGGCALCRTVRPVFPSVRSHADCRPRRQTHDINCVHGRTKSCSGSSRGTASNTRARRAGSSPDAKTRFWAVVAFLKRIPALDAESYRSNSALGGVRIPGQSGQQLATVEIRISAECRRVRAPPWCRGQRAGERAGVVLHGQPAEFLMTALQQNAEGTRRSGIMEPLAADLEVQIRRPAEYYAKLAPPKTQPGATDSDIVERGRGWQSRADPGNGIPAANACHGHDALASDPRLAGQNAADTGGTPAPLEGRPSQGDRWRRDHGADRTATGR